MKAANVRAFFAFMNERHAIYLRKEVEGKPPPWTKDPMLATYRFTNVFRRLDRVTRFYIDEVYKPNYDRPASELVFNTTLFRAFNWPPTWPQLGGWQKTWGEKKERRLAAKIAAWGAEGNQVYTGAYMVRADSEPGVPKSYYVLGCMSKVWRGRKEVAAVAADTRSIQETTLALMKYPSMGGFTAYEVVCDLAYTKLLVGARDVNTWANPGPGAIRGLNRIREDDLKHRVPKDQCIAEMCELLERSKKRGGWRYGERWPLQLREIEHSLCEYDKYCRGRSRSRYRPETRY